MRVNRDGQLLQQVTAWLLVEQVDLLKADGINVSRFLREQIETLYEDPTASPQETRARLVQRAHESLARHRAAQAERDADLERARAAVREKRAERDAAISRHGGILEALVQIGGDGPIGRLSRMLPENDFNGDRLDDWEALVRRVSRLCGAEIDSAEVAAGVRDLIAAKP